MSSSSTTPRRRFLRRGVVLPVVAVAVVALAIGVWWFQPWKLVTSTTVAEDLPTTSADATAPTVVARGTLISHEHQTTGAVTLLRLPDESMLVRLEGLDTSNGPDLHVLLTDAPVLLGTDGWHVFDQSRHLDLGSLKGNRGDANYPVPTGVDVMGLNSVSVWCDRFDVSFGAAALTPVG